MEIKEEEDKAKKEMQEEEQEKKEQGGEREGRETILTRRAGMGRPHSWEQETESEGNH